MCHLTQLKMVKNIYSSGAHKVHGFVWKHWKLVLSENMTVLTLPTADVAQLIVSVRQDRVAALAKFADFWAAHQNDESGS